MGWAGERVFCPTGQIGVHGELKSAPPDVLSAAPCAKLHLMGVSTKTFVLRTARSDDLRFVWSLYEQLMKPLTEELLGRWNEAGQKQVVDIALAHEGTSIIEREQLDVGWVQVIESPDTLYLAQLHIAPSSQNCGIGTAILRELTDRARARRATLTLDVMKNNRSRQLYDRLGFQVIGQSEYKLKMQWPESVRLEPDSS